MWPTTQDGPTPPLLCFTGGKFASRSPPPSRPTPRGPKHRHQRPPQQAPPGLLRLPPPRQLLSPSTAGCAFRRAPHLTRHLLTRIQGHPAATFRAGFQAEPRRSSPPLCGAAPGNRGLAQSGLTQCQVSSGSHQRAGLLSLHPSAPGLSVARRASVTRAGQRRLRHSRRSHANRSVKAAFIGGPPMTPPRLGVNLQRDRRVAIC